MVTTHTPGPWTVSGSAGLEIRSENFGGIGFVHTPLRGGNRETEDRAIAAANARLMATSPELLDALRALARGARDYPCFCGVATGKADTHTRACVNAVAAINKAEGR